MKDEQIMVNAKFKVENSFWPEEARLITAEMCDFVQLKQVPAHWKDMYIGEML